MEKDELALQICDAFGKTMYPNVKKWLTWKKHDDYKEVNEAFSGKHWTSITDVQFLRSHVNALALFKPEAFCFYLPAFMLAALDEPSLYTFGSLEFYLTPSKFDEFPAHFLAHARGFSREQKQAIKAFLQFYFQLTPGHPLSKQEQLRKQVLHFWDTFEG